MREPTESAPIQAAIYARISNDREGAGLGVERQENDCRELAERLGWEVVEVFVDNDISAHSGKTRPAYRAMLEAAKAGRIRGVIAWHTDRLHRRTLELEEFVRVAETHHLHVQTVTAGEIDLATPTGRMVARMLGAAAQHEVEHAIERMRAAHAQKAQRGEYRGGLRPYGFEPDGVTIRESEAEVVRRATRSVLAGRSLRAIARELNEEGYRTAGWGKNSPPKPWDYQRLRAMLMRPRNAGHSHTGRADRGQAVIVKENAWPAIVPDEEWRAVYAMLSDSSRRQTNSNATRWLGSGIFRCGRDGCGATMRVTPLGGTASRKHERVYIYRCSEQHHLAVNQPKTDEYVRRTVADLIRDPRVVAAMTNEDEGATADRARRETLLARLAQFENDYAEGIITGAQLQRATANVNAELEQIEERMTRSTQRSVSSAVMGAHDPGDAFLAAPIDVQRAIVATVISVEVQPAPYRGAAWTPDRLLITPAS